MIHFSFCFLYINGQTSCPSCMDQQFENSLPTSRFMCSSILQMHPPATALTRAGNTDFYCNCNF